MFGTAAMWAGLENTRRSRGNDRDLERYLRTEYLGGTTLAALTSDPWLRRFTGAGSVHAGPRRKSRGIATSVRVGRRSAIVRIATSVMVFLRRAKPMPDGRKG